MDKDNENTLKQFLGEIDEIKEVPENDIFANKEPEEPIIPEEPEEKPEKRVSFAKDEKVQRYIDKEIAKRLEDFKPQQVEERKSNDTTDVVEAFTAIIGNDTPEKVSALKALERALDNVDQRASQRAVEKLDEIRLQEVMADKQAEDELSDAFDAIEDTFDVDITSSNALVSKQRREFISFVEKIAPKDRNGDIVEYPDMISAWETFQEMKTKEPSRAKELANRSMSRSVETQATAPQKRVTFEDADAFIETLK